MSAVTDDPEALRRAGLRVDRDGPVLRITLDRPATRNSQTPATWEALRAIGESLGPAVRVVVVQGAGESFSSGLDRRMLSPEGVDGPEADLEGERPLLDLLRLDDDALAETIAGYQAGFRWLRSPDIVSVAAVQGHAIGAGFQLALACDLRVLSEDASLAMRETSLGLVPDLTGTKPLVELVGYARALELCATTRPVGAQEARELGLATAVVARSELDATVADLVAALLEPLPGAVRETKALLLSAGTLDLDAQLREERIAQVRRFRELAAAMQD